MHISIIVIVALASAGCALGAKRRIEARIRADLDLDALTPFVKQVIADHPSFAGFALSTNIDGRWTLVRSDPLSARMRSGDWTLFTQGAPDGSFQVYMITKSRPWAGLRFTRSDSREIDSSS